MEGEIPAHFFFFYIFFFHTILVFLLLFSRTRPRELAAGRKPDVATGLDTLDVDFVVAIALEGGGGLGEG